MLFIQSVEFPAETEMRDIRDYLTYRAKDTIIFMVLSFACRDPP
jgi:hypothetical protein